ncbi:MAG: leucine-rich repeat domain-containing protein [Clostridia bacterium]|nr:leucine-rich repeat domain-containing protein [Clostridia bacterium]
MRKTIQRLLSLALCLLLCAALLPGTVWAAEIVDSGTCGKNLTWTLDSDGKLTISGTGEMKDFDWNPPPWYGKRSSVNTVEIHSGVTSIGRNAFSDCSSLTSVTIPDSVTSIGDGAFSDCDSLTSVTIGNSVTSIGEFAFWRCSSLTSVTIPNSVTSIGGCAFEATPWLQSLGDFAIVNHILLRYQGSETDVTIPNSVTSIGSYAFSGCSSLTNVTIPDSVTSIGGTAFYNCRSLTSVTIPNSVTSIGDSAFDGCSSLTSVNIPDSVTSIGGTAFYYCSGLTSVTIPDSVTSIGFWAFEGCSSLTDVYYGGTEDQWNAIEGDGKPSGNRITIHYFDADPSNPLGRSQPYIVGEGNKAAAVVNIASPTDRPMTVYSVRYSAAGQLLGIDAYTLEAGQSGQLDIPFENGDYLRIFATDADTYAPLCKNLQVDRPA